MENQNLNTALEICKNYAPDSTFTPQEGINPDTTHFIACIEDDYEYNLYASTAEELEESGMDTETKNGVTVGFDD